MSAVAVTNMCVVKLQGLLHYAVVTNKDYTAVQGSDALPVVQVCEGS